MELFTSVRVSVMDLIALLYRNQFLLSSVRGLVRRRESGVVKILEESDTTTDNISDSNYRLARTMRSEREPTLGTEMDIQNTLIEGYIRRFHRLVQREGCQGVIQMTRLVHHMLVK